MEKKLASGQIPEELANNPFMSKENMKKLLEFNKEIMTELKESGGELDQAAIKEKVEVFKRKIFTRNVNTLRVVFQSGGKRSLTFEMVEGILPLMKKPVESSNTTHRPSKR